MPEDIHPDTIPGRLIARAAERPNDVAIELIGAEPLTYSHWLDSAMRAASALMATGLKHGDRIILPCATSNFLEYAVAYVAVQTAGGVPIPVLSHLGEPHLKSVLERSRAVAIIGDDEIPRTWRWALHELTQSWIKDLTAPVAPDHIAEILYTSGTTGQPKGVAATHRNLLFTHTDDEKRPRRVTLHAIPPGTNAGQGIMHLALHPSPHRIVTLPEFRADSFLRAIESSRPDVVVLVPAFARAILDREDPTQYDLSSVSLVRSVSAPITPVTLAGLAQAFPAAAISNFYTTTEAYPARVRVTFDPQRPTALGKPDGASAVRIVDPNNSPVPPGVDGEVLLRAVGAPQRTYVDDLNSALDVFLPDGWTRTGDIGHLDKDGYLYLVDRINDLVISGGENLSGIETENAAAEFPGVTGAAAFGVPHDVLGEVLALAVTGDLDPAELEAFLDQRLGDAKAPKHVILLAEIPRNELGKPLKNELRARYKTPPANTSTDPGPAPHEDHIRELWSNVLRLSAVPTNASFLDLGGTSFDARTIIADVAELLSRDIQPRALYQAPNVRAFAWTVAKAPETTALRQTPIPRLPRNPASQDPQGDSID